MREEELSSLKVVERMWDDERTLPVITICQVCNRIDVRANVPSFSERTKEWTFSSGRIGETVGCNPLGDSL